MRLEKRANGQYVVIARRSELTAIEASVKKKAKWGEKDVVNPSEKGKYDGKSEEELRSMLSSAKKSQESWKENHDGKAKKELSDKIRELNFAIRAKSGWGKV